MENYQKHYYALFNQITDLITELGQKKYSQSVITEKLRQIQRDAEERFLEDGEDEEDEE